jgi:hypothetical protein
MPLHYVRDDVKRRIGIALTEAVTVDELIETVERQLVDGAWAYGVLVDGRAMRDLPKPKDIQAFVACVRELVAVHGPRGPMAFVSSESGVFSTAEMYLFLGGKTDALEVFGDIADAQRWLDELRGDGREMPEESVRRDPMRGHPLGAETKAEEHERAVLH